MTEPHDNSSRVDVESMISGIREAGANPGLANGKDSDTPVDLQGNLSALNAGYRVGRTPGRGLRAVLYPFARYVIRSLVDDVTAFNSGVVRVLNQISRHADHDRAELEQRIERLEETVEGLKSGKGPTCE